MHDARARGTRHNLGERLDVRAQLCPRHRPPTLDTGPKVFTAEQLHTKPRNACGRVDTCAYHVDRMWRLEAGRDARFQGESLA